MGDCKEKIYKNSVKHPLCAKKQEINGFKSNCRHYTLDSSGNSAAFMGGYMAGILENRDSPVEISCGCSTVMGLISTSGFCRIDFGVTKTPSRHPGRSPGIAGEGGSPSGNRPEKTALKAQNTPPAPRGRAQPNRPDQKCRAMPL